jgi:hypothetical protein
MGIPEMGFPNASFTWTTSGCGSVEPTAPVWLSPERATISLAFTERAITWNAVDGAWVPSGTTTRAWPAWAPIVVPSTIRV